ncbi:MAG: Ribosomal large subunit pseudouridine synthase D [Chloroflexi bacterium]|nr:Ribosomal large subunit pseudouridine synthase D [Chloroflexota bacterium]
MSEQTFTFIYQAELEKNGASLRLDKVLAAELEDYSRSQLQKLIKAGKVLVDGHPVLTKAEQVPPGAEIRVQVPPPQPTHLQPEKIPLDVVFENDDILVVNKSAGMVVHPAPGHETGTLVQAALAHSPEIEGVGGVKRPGLVHRLDRFTSGLILLAKNDHAQHVLQDQFQERTVEKEYHALVDGRPPTPKGRVEVAIGRDPTNRKRMAPVLPQHGKEAISEYYTIEEFKNHTLLEVHILTGRTHQIRVHMAFLECPVVGDAQYGFRNPTLPIKRQFLHAARLSIIIPGESEPSTFEAPLPPELVQVLDELRVS